MQKDSAKNLIQNALQNSFNKEQFVYLLKNIVNRFDESKAFHARGYVKEKFNTTTKIVKTYERIGTYTDPEDKKIDLLIVYLQREKSIESARTSLRNFAADYLKQRGMKDAALVAFVSPNGDDWRFSLVKMEYKFTPLDSKTSNGVKREIKVEEEFTPARRYSFLVGKNENSHTAQSRLLPLLLNDEINPSLKDLEDAFSVEKVTKEFFEKYRDLFLRLKESLDDIVNKDPKIKADFTDKNVCVTDFAKKLLGQIVFLYFLQKKGWFGVPRGKDWGEGDKKFLRNLFEVAQKENKNYFNRFLEPLFYEALRLERPKDYYDQFNCRIPFLNGGLFDPINDYDWQDTDIEIPDEIFSNNSKTKEGDIGDGILDIFDRYNFTVKEDEPLEKEVAIDPEMLGKVFENLLEVKDRKSKGTYYTPREIVHYMCQESLANYLTTELNCNTDIPVCSKKEIDILIKYGETAVEHDATYLEKTAGNESYKGRYDKAKLPDSIRQHAKLIDEKLASIRVCDPAVGSGAFPVGMMNEIIRTRNALTPYIESNIDIPVCDSDIHITHRNLPHWTKDGSIYWITFRLADSLPHEKLDNWKTERNQWVSKHPEPWSELEWKEYNERFGDRLEGWLDAGYGCCVLSRPEVRKIFQECLLRFDEERLRIHAAVIMPNHIHLLLSPLKNHSLSELLKGIKGASARRINHLLGKTGTTFWMDESYDHIVRSEAQYQHFLTYITENPVKAGLSQNQYWLYQSVKSSTGISACVDLSSQTRMSVPRSSGMSVPRSSYHFKRHAIQNCLYGVDIDPGAVEIAKLRLWLSLVVDEEDIKQIKPLPNLDYKIVCGNSLLGVEKNLFNADLFNELEELKPLYFNETNASKKQEYKNQIDELISQITNGHKDFDFEVYFSEVFHEKKGFDVVIANPPYVQIKQIPWHERKVYEKRFRAAVGRFNIFYFFLEIAGKIARPIGVSAFIVPDRLLLNTQCGELRKWLLQDQTILEIDSFKEGVFDAVVDSVIIFYQNTKSSSDHIKVKDRVSLDSLKQNVALKIPVTYFLESPTNQFDLSYDLATASLLKKIKSVSVRLGDISDIKDGIIQGKVADMLFLDAPLDGSSKPLLFGEDVTKYVIRFNNKWANYKPSEMMRLEVKRRGVGVRHGLWMRTPEIFERPKILTRQTADEIIASYDTQNYYYSNTLHGTTITDANYDPLYVLALLNSRLMTWYYRSTTAEEGKVFAQIKIALLRLLPIKKAAQDQWKPIINLVNEILAITKDPEGKPSASNGAGDDYLASSAKQAKVREYEKQIDQMVYELYGLTKEEIKIVEGFGKED